MKQSWLDAAEIVDAWRVFPRLFVGAYLCIVLWLIVDVIMSPDPSLAQAALVGVLGATFVPMLKFYVDSGRSWG